MPTFKNILYPLNLESKNLKNVTVALECALEFKAAIHFLFVNDESAGYRHPTDFQDAVALKIKETVPGDMLEKVKVMYAVSKGKLGAEVKEYCKKQGIDLIITSHKQHSKLYTSLFDTPDENIIDTVNIPVLIFPKK